MTGLEDMPQINETTIGELVEELYEILNNHKDLNCFERSSINNAAQLLRKHFSQKMEFNDFNYRFRDI